MDYYIHMLPGRIRIRTTALQKNDLGIHSASKLLKIIRGVISVKGNSRTGSVLVYYDSHQVSSQWILCKLAHQGFIPAIQWNTSVSYPIHYCATVQTN